MVNLKGGYLKKLVREQRRKKQNLMGILVKYDWMLGLGEILAATKAYHMGSMR